VTLTAVVGATCAIAACGPPPEVAPLERRPVLDTLGIPPLDQIRLTSVYATGFENDADLAGFYVTPQSPMTRHEVRSGINAHAGQRFHVGWLTGETGVEPVDGPNHRGYPTIQLPQRPVGTCITPCLVQFWAKLDGVELHQGEWFSLATFSSDASNRWTRVITVNVGSEGWLFLFHVPDQGAGDRLLQRTDLPFPRGRWVRITTWLDLDPDHGAAAVWQDGVLVSAARVRGGDGSLDQMHFGLYAPPSLTHGKVANDDIAVYRVTPTQP
jgi:hypothetical protein